MDARTSSIVLGLGLVALYAALRTLNAPEAVLLAWTAMAAMLTVLSLAGGLTILAAIGPFTEALTDEGRITAIPFLLAALGVGFLIALARLAIARQLPRPPLPIVLAGVLFAGTLLGVGLSALSFGANFGLEALQLWVSGIGGGLTVLFAAWLVGRTGEYRPLVVVVGSITLAAVLSVADVLLDGAVRESALGWLLRSDVGPERLTGVIPAPNAAAAIFLVAVPFAAVGALSLHPLAIRLAAVGAGVVLLVAVGLTQSRSGLLALVVITALLAWHYRRWLGLVGVAALLLLGLLAVAMSGLTVLRDVPFWADEARLDAWSASIQMWLEAPLTGHGLRSFEWLHTQYGSTLDAPHNEWLRFFAEGGLTVGVAAIAFLVFALVPLLRPDDWIAVAVGASLAGVVIMAGFNNPFLYAQVTIPAFLTLGARLQSAHSSQGPAVVVDEENGKHGIPTAVGQGHWS